MIERKTETQLNIGFRKVFLAWILGSWGLLGWQGWFLRSCDLLGWILGSWGLLGWILNTWNFLGWILGSRGLLASILNSWGPGVF